MPFLFQGWQAAKARCQVTYNKLNECSILMREERREEARERVRGDVRTCMAEAVVQCNTHASWAESETPDRDGSPRHALFLPLFFSFLPAGSPACPRCAGVLSEEELLSGLSVCPQPARPWQAMPQGQALSGHRRPLSREKKLVERERKSENRPSFLRRDMN